jgi:hypothetical protein
MSFSLDRSYLAIGLTYGALGMGLGIHMAATQNHGQLVTHAHLLLVGFLLSVIYAIIHRLWLDQPQKWLARTQFAAHHIGVVMMVTGLFLLYGGHFPHQRLEPLLASSSIIVLLALLLMLMMVLVMTSSPGASATASSREAIDARA